VVVVIRSLEIPRPETEYTIAMAPVAEAVVARDEGTALTEVDGQTPTTHEFASLLV
jgi:hypothetical protein